MARCSTSSPSPASAAARRSPIPCVFIARRPSFERDDRSVLASLLADCGPLPDSVSYLAKLLNVSVRTARTYRDALVAAGNAESADGWLRIDASGFARWQDLARADFASRGERFTFDAVPRAALAWSLSTTELRALAVHFGEAVGAHATRRGVRTDAERCAQGGVGRRYVVDARKTLAAHGCRVTVRHVAFRLPNGKAADKLLRRVELPDDPAARKDLCKMPALLAGRVRLAAVAAAQSGRSRIPTAGRSRVSGRWSTSTPSATKEQDPSATKVALPIAPSEGASPSPRFAAGTDGALRAAGQGWAGPAKPGGAGLIDALAAGMRPGARRSEPMPWEREVGPVEHLADVLSLDRVADLRRKPPLVAVAGVLQAARVFAWANAPMRVQRRLGDRCQRLADEAVSVLGAAVLDDVVRLARKARRKSNPGAWLAAALSNRIARVRAGLDARPDFDSRRGEPRDHTKHEDRARRVATGGAVAAVQAGDWRGLLRFAEAGADLASVGSQTGRTADELQRIVLGAREARAARFAESRRRSENRSAIA